MSLMVRGSHAPISEFSSQKGFAKGQPPPNMSACGNPNVEPGSIMLSVYSVLFIIHLTQRQKNQNSMEIPRSVSNVKQRGEILLSDTQCIASAQLMQDYGLY